MNNELRIMENAKKNNPQSRSLAPRLGQTKNSGNKPKFFGVDRGGVKPLEQAGKTAPENRSDSALVHEVDTIRIIKNRKAPSWELFGVTNNLVRSSLANLATSIAYGLSTCQTANKMRRHNSLFPIHNSSPMSEDHYSLFIIHYSKYLLAVLFFVLALFLANAAHAGTIIKSPAYLGLSRGLSPLEVRLAGGMSADVNDVLLLTGQVGCLPR